MCNLGLKMCLNTTQIAKIRARAHTAQPQYFMSIPANVLLVKSQFFFLNFKDCIQKSVMYHKCFLNINHNIDAHKQRLPNTEEWSFKIDEIIY